jgi:hypothetical protein
MRTITAARDEPPTADEPAEPTAVERARAEPGAEMPEAVAGVQAELVEPPSVAVTAVRMLKLDEGLYALRVGRIDGSPGEISGMTVPMAQVSAPFAEDGNGVEIVASFPRRGSWLDQEGGTLIMRTPLGGGYVIVTVYGQPDQALSVPALDLRRLDRPDESSSSEAASGPAAADPLASATEPREIATEILLHIERAGDRLFPGRGWVGALGRKLRIEAFSIRPLERLAPIDIEFKGYLPNGTETQWVHGGILCGTRGRRLPLTGFAVRVAPHLADRFEVTYQGSFFMSGISGVHRNGEPCRVVAGEDQLEALNIRLVERAVGPEKIDAVG